jgi:Pyruvate/2-oxoacid:ferredoxin oxidoreductase gamma subunit
MDIPATKIADELGNTRIANMVILGALVGYTNILNKDTLTATLPHIISRKRLIDINKEAIYKGFEFGSEFRHQHQKGKN